MHKFLTNLTARLQIAGVDTSEVKVSDTRHDETKDVNVVEVKYENCYFAIYSQTDDDRLLNVVFWRDKSERVPLPHVSQDLAIDFITRQIQHAENASYVNHLHAKG